MVFLEIRHASGNRDDLLSDGGRLPPSNEVSITTSWSVKFNNVVGGNGGLTPTVPIQIRARPRQVTEYHARGDGS